MHIDLRFSVLSFFLVWGALILTMITAVAYVYDRPRRQTTILVIATLALWLAGTLIPILT